MDLVEKARVFATASHTAVKQVRKYTGDPYIIHPKEVADLTQAFVNGRRRYQVACEWVAAAWLHDVVEDCFIPPEIIVKEFGETVGVYVAGLTDVSKLTDGNRKVRKQKDLMHTAEQGFEVQTIKCFEIRNNDRSITLSDDGFKYTWKDEKKALIAALVRADPLALKLLEQPLTWTHEQDVMFLLHDDYTYG